MMAIIDVAGPHRTAQYVAIGATLAGVRGIAFTRFTSADVVRHPLVQKIIDAYERDDNK